jgi:hypothetical protein
MGVKTTAAGSCHRGQRIKLKWTDTTVVQNIVSSHVTMTNTSAGMIDEHGRRETSDHFYRAQRGATGDVRLKGTAMLPSHGLWRVIVHVSPQPPMAAIAICPAIVTKCDCSWATGPTGSWALVSPAARNACSQDDGTKCNCKCCCDVRRRQGSKTPCKNQFNHAEAKQGGKEAGKAAGRSGGTGRRLAVHDENMYTDGGQLAAGEHRRLVGVDGSGTELQGALKGKAEGDGPPGAPGKHPPMAPPGQQQQQSQQQQRQQQIQGQGQGQGQGRRKRQGPTKGPGPPGLAAKQKAGQGKWMGMGSSFSTGGRGGGAGGRGGKKQYGPGGGNGGKGHQAAKSATMSQQKWNQLIAAESRQAKQSKVSSETYIQ